MRLALCSLAASTSSFAARVALSRLELSKQLPLLLLGGVQLFTHSLD